MKTKTILAATFIFCFLGSGASPSFAAEAAKPNILFILTDDQGWPTLGSYGGAIVPTPNLDRLATEGARFTNAYVTPICTPTRATLLSGQYTARNGMWHVPINPWYGSPWARMEEIPFVDQYPRDDIGEQHNLAAADPGRAAALTEQLHDWMDTVGARPSEPNPHHDPDRAFVTTTRKPDWLKSRP